MNWQNFIRGLIVSTLIFGGILLSLTFFSSPEKGIVTIVIFYLSAFFFIFGLAGMIGFTLRRWWMHNEMLFENVKISVRQAILFSAFCASVLVLSAMRLLTWWDGLILAISFLLVEMYFKTRR